MKFVILALLALASGLHAAKLDLKTLGFVLYGKHGEGTKVTVDAGTCPLGTLPDTVFLHKTFKKGQLFFTWVRPVHARVDELVCGTHNVWKAGVGEVLLDLHFVGKPDGVKFLHLELFHPVVGTNHLFLRFAGGATPGVGVHLGLAAFVVGVHRLMPLKGLHELEGLPAHPLLHAWAAHAAHLAHTAGTAKDGLAANGGVHLPEEENCKCPTSCDNCSCCKSGNCCLKHGKSCKDGNGTEGTAVEDGTLGTTNGADGTVVEDGAEGTVVEDGAEGGGVA